MLVIVLPRCPSFPIINLILYILTKIIRTMARTKTLEASWEAKRGGFLIFTDFAIWSPGEQVDNGVPYVVCELWLDYGFKFVYFAPHSHLYNDAALRRPLAWGSNE